MILAGSGIHDDLLHAADAVETPKAGALASWEELDFWEKIEGSNNPKQYKAYLQAYPKGRFARLAERRIQKLTKGETKLGPVRVRLLDLIKDRWSDQIVRTSKIQDEHPIDLTGPNGTPVVQGGYVVTSPRNPLIDANCRAESLADAVAVWAQAHKVSDEEAFADREAHIRDLQAQFKTGATFTAWIRHVAKCKEFCLIAVQDLLACHVQAVSALHHGLVFFGFDSDRIDPGASAAVDDFVAQLRDGSERRVLLIGRASHLGSAGPAYNRSLSARRARTVFESLTYRGIPPDSIQTLSIGYEEPQLTKETAGMYGVSEHFHRLGETGINQSVVMVLY